MPYAIIRKGTGYLVQNEETGRVYSRRAMSKVKASAQKRILELVEKK